MDGTIKLSNKDVIEEFITLLDVTFGEDENEPLGLGTVGDYRAKAEKMLMALENKGSKSNNKAECLEVAEMLYNAMQAPMLIKEVAEVLNKDKQKDEQIKKSKVATIARYGLEAGMFAFMPVRLLEEQAE